MLLGNVIKKRKEWKENATNFLHERKKERTNTLFNLHVIFSWSNFIESQNIIIIDIYEFYNWNLQIVRISEKTDRLTEKMWNCLYNYFIDKWNTKRNNILLKGIKLFILFWAIERQENMS